MCVCGCVCGCGCVGVCDVLSLSLEKKKIFSLLLLGFELETVRSRNLSGNIHPQSSRLAKLLWTDPGLKGGIGVRELIST